MKKILSICLLASCGNLGFAAIHSCYKPGAEFNVAYFEPLARLNRARTAQGNLRCLYFHRPGYSTPKEIDHVYIANPDHRLWKRVDEEEDREKVVWQCGDHVPGDDQDNGRNCAVSTVPVA